MPKKKGGPTAKEPDGTSSPLLVAAVVAMVAGLWMFASTDAPAAPTPVVEQSRQPPPPQPAPHLAVVEEEDFKEPKSSTKWVVQEDEDVSEHAQRMVKDDNAPVLNKIATPALEAAETWYAAGDVPRAMELVEDEMARSLG
jgi:hypothetical protein